MNETAIEVSEKPAQIVSTATQEMQITLTVTVRGKPEDAEKLAQSVRTAAEILAPIAK